MGGYVSLCSWKEMRSLGDNGMRANIHVQRNRVMAPGWVPSDIIDPYHYVVFQPGQFPSMSDKHDPQYNLVPAANDPQYEYAVMIAPLVMSGTDTDLTNNALYYAVLSEISPNGWFATYIVGRPKDHRVTATIGNTTFFA